MRVKEMRLKGQADGSMTVEVTTEDGQEFSFEGATDGNIFPTDAFGEACAVWIQHAEPANDNAPAGDAA